MAKQTEIGRDYVKKSTMVLVSLIFLMTGFLGGIVLSAYKSASGIPSPGPATPPQAQSGPNPSAENAGRILALEKELSSHPDNIEALIQLGHLYFDTHQFKKAIGVYERSLAIDPENADVLTDLGVMYRRDGQPQKAIEQFDRAIAVDPRHEISRFNRGIVLMHDLNDTEGALKSWEGLVQMNPMAQAPNGMLIREMVAKLRQGGR